MAIRNQSWYDLNESRPWPISDEATAIADDGTRLPNRVIADLRISIPREIAQRAFISAVAITPTLATVTILGCNDLDPPVDMVPLAAITLPKPFDAYRIQPLRPLYPGVHGSIVFGREAARGDDNLETFTARFSSPRQSALHPATVQAYAGLPVASIGRLGEADPLTGIVRLSGGNDIEVVKECREIPTVAGDGCDPNISTALDVIVIRLREQILQDTPGIAPVPSSSADRQVNVFDLYRGPCSGRPESASCGDPQPIELLASVPPDCCGNIDLVLRGCAVPSRVVEQALVIDDIIQSVESTCGIVLDCHLSLAEACITPDRLPAPDGRLPNEYDDLCESVSEVSITLPTPAPEEEISLSIISSEEDAAADEAPSLPYCNNFSSSDPDIAVESGSWLLRDNGQGRQVWTTEGLYGSIVRNAAVWDYDWNPFYKRAYTRVQMLSGSGTENLHNAALVANYRETAVGSGLFSYYVAEIDYDGHYQGYKLFRIGRFNGRRWNTEFAVPVPALSLGDLYDIYLTIYPVKNRPDSAWLLARLVGVTNPSIDVTVGPLLENEFPSDGLGKFGMGTTRAPTRFYHFCLENTADVVNGPPATEP